MSESGYLTPEIVRRAMEKVLAGECPGPRVAPPPLRIGEHEPPVEVDPTLPSSIFVFETK